MNKLAALITFALFLACFGCGWLAAEIPHDGVAREAVDLIEINHFYSEEAAVFMFDQAIFMDWSEDFARYQVRAWRLVKSPAQLPQRDWNGGYTAVWQDGELMRCVRAKQVRETWSQYDPELAERDYLAKELRKELSTPKTKSRR